MSGGSLTLGPGPEFDRIRRIVARLGPAAGTVGDDCAVLPWTGGAVVLSTDMSVEEVHFRREWLSLAEIGGRAAAAALSDLAAEGAQVVGVLVSLGVPPEAGEGDPAELMAGVGAQVRSVGGTVLGGDLTRAARWLVDVTVVGRADRPVTRAGARPGDGLWLSGQLGGARVALEAWRAGTAPPAGARAAFAAPVPRLALGQGLAAAGARAMIDLSDGLGGDAGHLAAASEVGLEIELERLPLHPDVPAAAARLGLEPARFAAEGGEDYELLVALPPEVDEAELRALARDAGTSLTRIGRVAAGRAVQFRSEGRAVALRGYDHFA